jgi:DsbC/DsbD-like thiol-disulfide interchange protein
MLFIVPYWIAVSCCAVTVRRVIPTAALVLACVAGSARAQSFSSRAPQRLSVAIEPPTRPIAIGERFSLLLRITPNPGIHVYAPGNPDNIPVSVAVAPAPGIAADAATFPKAEDFFFGPLAETFKVYTKPFVVTVPMRVEGKTSAGTDAKEIAVTGTIRYQACDDRVCFPPQSLPFQTRVPLGAGTR